VKRQTAWETDIQSVDQLIGRHAGTLVREADHRLGVTESLPPISAIHAIRPRSVWIDRRFVIQVTIRWQGLRVYRTLIDGVFLSGLVGH